MSKPNLPPLPPMPPEIIVDESVDGGAIYGQDVAALRAWATAYAEEAVRQALEQAAIKAVETLKDLTTEMEGYSYFGSNPGVKEDDYEDVAEAIRALIPEKDHGEST